MRRLRAHAPGHRALQRECCGVDRKTDGAHPTQPGQHQRRVQALLRDDQRVAHAVGVGGNLHRHRHHQRNRHAQAQRHEQPRHDGRADDPDKALPGREL
jgi:hypothetical protein